MTEVSIRGAGASAVTYRVGGREYPMTTNRQCKVCMSPHRFSVEEALIEGRTYDKIIDHLPGEHDLSPRNVKDHYLNGHLPLATASTRQIVEARAQELGKRIEDSAEALVDGITLARTVVQKTFEAIARGEIEPEVSDGLRAFKMLSDLGEYDEGGADASAMTEAFLIYHETAESTMSAEQFRAFGEALEANPVLKALVARHEGREVETVPGEVTDTD